MPEEQTPAANSSDANLQNQTTPAGAEPAQQSSASKPKGSSKGWVIAIIIVLIVVVLALIGSYLVYRYIKGKVNITENSSSVTVGNSTSSVSTSGDSYGTVTEQNITQDLAKQIDAQIKPIMAKIFGAVKVKAWSAYESDSGSIGYITKDKVSNDLINQIEPALKTAGYTSTLSSVDQSGAVISGASGDISVYIYLDSQDNVNDITVAFSKTATGDTSASPDTIESTE